MNSIFNEQRLKNYLLQTFKHYGIIIRDDHFVYASGKHGDAYVNKDAIYVQPELVNQVVTLMVFMVRDQGRKFSVVAGPALGGIPLAQTFAQKWLALFGETKQVIIIEKDKTGNYVLKRGYDNIVKHKPVLLVEDILTTGKSIGLCIDVLRRHEAQVVQIVNIWQRGEDIDSRGVPFQPLMKEIFPMYEAAECPLCAKKVPINLSLGKGQQFCKS